LDRPEKPANSGHKWLLWGAGGCSTVRPYVWALLPYVWALLRVRCGDVGGACRGCQSLRLSASDPERRGIIPHCMNARGKGRTMREAVVTASVLLASAAGAQDNIFEVLKNAPGGFYVLHVIPWQVVPIWQKRREGNERALRQTALGRNLQALHAGGTSAPRHHSRHPRYRPQARIIVEVEARACPLRQLQNLMGVWGCFRIYRPSSVRRFRPRKL